MSLELKSYLYAYELWRTSSYMLAFSDIKTCSGFKIARRNTHVKLYLTRLFLCTLSYKIPVLWNFRQAKGRACLTFTEKYVHCTYFSTHRIAVSDKGNGVHKSGQVLTVCPQKWTAHNKQARAGVHKSGQYIINKHAQVSTKVDNT